MQNLGGRMRRVIGIFPPKQRRQFRSPFAQGAVQMESTPKDDMLGDFSGRAQTRYQLSLQLFLGERRDGTLEGFLVVLPAFEGTRLRYGCSSHVLDSVSI
jgi:hypothetical protein